MFDQVLLSFTQSKAVSLTSLADQLNTDPETVRGVIDMLCDMQYCKKVDMGQIEGNCRGGCSKSCSSTSLNKIVFWSITEKGKSYILKLKKGNPSLADRAI